MKSYTTFTCLALVLAGSSRAVAESHEGVKLEMRDGRPVVDGVFINDHGPYRFLVDTGSTLNHFDPKLARAIGLATTLQTTLTSSIGATSATGTEGAEIRLGSVIADQQVLLFAGIEGLHAISPDIQGVLGQVFLSRFDYRINLRNGRLEFGRYGLDAKATRIAFRTVEGRPVISTSLGWLVLDSGAHYLVRFGVRATVETHEMVTASGTVGVGTVFSKLVIAGHPFWRGDAIAVPELSEPSADGLLPIAPFNSVYVSNSEGYVVLK
jgi:hypothetical protein